MADTFRILPVGTTLRIGRTGQQCRIRSFMDSGSQGAVYEVDVDGERFALKWYHSMIARDERLRERVRRAVERGAPDNRFLWPLAAVEAGGGFGYLMNLRPSGCVKFTRLFSSRASDRVILPLRDRAAVGAEIAEAFFSLHAKGLCYQDINFGAIFLDPQRLSVLICDNDNVDVDGQPATVAGTPRFMAPEIVRGDAQPSADTDLHSLAVLLFYLVFFHHPLDDLTAASRPVFARTDELEVFGEHPSFVFAPDVDVAELERHGLGPQRRLWGELAERTQQLFIRAFDAGLNAPRARVIETEWIEALRDLRDSCIACDSCGFEIPWKKSSGQAGDCCWCGARLQASPRLQIGGAHIVLAPGARIYGSRLGLPSAQLNNGVAGVVEGDHSEIQLRNLTSATWSIRCRDGRVRAASPDSSVALAVGDVLEFGGLKLGTVEI